MKLLVTTTGDERKVACESCIKGHRVAKCQHIDRVLFEVRPPGRPLGGCPHPAGKCPGHCAARYQPAFVVPGHGGMKTHEEDGSQYVEGRPIEPHEYPETMRKENDTLSARKAEDASTTKGQKRRRKAKETTQSEESTATSDHGSHSSGESPQNFDKGPRSNVSDFSMRYGDDALATHPSVKANKEEKLRLGMLGIGGFGAGRDEVAWGGDWPDSTSAEEMQSATLLPPAKKNCCCSSSDKRAQPNQPPSSSRHSYSSMSSNLTTPTNATTPSSGYNSNAYLGHDRRQLGNFDFPFTFTPLPAVAASQIDPRYDVDDCSCLSEQQCHCYGCAKHPGNPTHQSKNQELWELQGDQAYLERAAQKLSSPGEVTAIDGFDMAAASPGEQQQHQLQREQSHQHAITRGPFKYFSTLESPTPYQNVWRVAPSSAQHPHISTTIDPQTTVFEPYILHPSQYYSCISNACACGSGCQCVGCRVHGIHQPCDNYAMGNCKCGEGCACQGCVTQHLHLGGEASALTRAPSEQMMQIPATWASDNPHLDCSGRLLGGEGLARRQTHYPIGAEPSQHQAPSRVRNGSGSRGGSCCSGNATPTPSLTSVGFGARGNGSSGGGSVKDDMLGADLVDFASAA